MLKASKYEASHKIRFLRVVKDDDVDRMQEMCIRDRYKRNRNTTVTRIDTDKFHFIKPEE